MVGGSRPPSGTAGEIGRMLREQRQLQGLTLADLAARAKVSTSYVSQVERGVANPTLSSLKTLAESLNITVGALLDEEQAARPPEDPAESSLVSVLRAGQRRRVIYPGSNIANELLSPNLRMQMEVIWVEAPSGSGSGGHPHSHEGEECGVVIEGTMQFWVEDKTWTLGKRDAIYFPSHLPHRWVNPGKDDLVALWIVTPPTF